MQNKLTAWMKTGAAAVLITAALACGPTAAETATPGPAQEAREQAGSDPPWETILVRTGIGDKAFSMTLPPGWKTTVLEERPDAVHGEMWGETMEMWYIYGPTVKGPSPGPKQTRQPETIGQREAEIVTIGREALRDDRAIGQRVLRDDRAIGQREAEIVMPSQRVLRDDQAIGMFLPDPDGDPETPGAMVLWGKYHNEEERQKVLMIYRSIRVRTAAEGPLPPQPGQKALEAAVELAAQKMKVAESEVELRKWEPVRWRDGSLGCAKFGKTYAQMLIDGYLMTLGAGRKEITVHTDDYGEMVIIPKYCWQRDPKE